MNRKSFLGRFLTACAGLFAASRAKASKPPTTVVRYVPRFAKQTVDHCFFDISQNNMDAFMVRMLDEVNAVIEETIARDGTGRVSSLAWINLLSKDCNPSGTQGCVRVLFEYPITDRETAANVAQSGE